VIAVDIDATKVGRLKEGFSSLTEPGLDWLVAKGVDAGLLTATTDTEEAVMKSDISLMCFGASGHAGDSPIGYIKTACRQIGVALRKKGAFHSVVLRSKVARGTARSIAIPILEDCARGTAGIDFGFGNYPAFLRKGMAIRDYFNPPEIVIGALDVKTSRSLSELYREIGVQKTITDIDVAESLGFAGMAGSLPKAQVAAG
jgi:GDP-mannose 6-dehydrogenase